MALSTFNRFKRSTYPSSTHDGMLSAPSARATLLAGVGCMMVLSLLMVASASIPYAVSQGIPELYFFEHQLMYMGVGYLPLF